MVLLSIAAMALAVLAAWSDRNYMNPDGVAYLDLGQALVHGDWNNAINGYWSPLYPASLGTALALLNPSMFGEFTVVHYVNVVWFLIALASFHFFLTGAIRRPSALPQTDSGLPEWTLLSLGYALFIAATLELIPIKFVTPDIGVSAAVYLATGLLLRIRPGEANWLRFLSLGAVLGLGYLMKLVMFPLAFMLLGIALVLMGDPKKSIPAAMLSAAVFLVFAGPFIFALSISKGRFTVGDSGKLNYSFLVNVTRTIQWNGDPPWSGAPRHVTRKIFSHPDLYEFAEPIGGAYAAWYDPSYWNEGKQPRFHLDQQLRRLFRSAAQYVNLFLVSQAAVLVGALALYCFKPHASRAAMKTYWPIFLCGILPMLLYSFVSVETRLIASFVVLFWIGVFVSVRFHFTQDLAIVTSRISALIVTVVMLQALWSVYTQARSGVTDNIQAEVAANLHRMGIPAGSKVGFIGRSFDAYWAHLGRFRITCEIPESTFDNLTYTPPSTDADQFWAADQSTQRAALNTMAATGVACVLAKNAPAGAMGLGWKRIGLTNYYVIIPPVRTGTS